MHNNVASVAWPSGLRRWFKASVSAEAWVRIPPLPACHLLFCKKKLYPGSAHRPLQEGKSCFCNTGPFPVSKETDSFCLLSSLTCYLSLELGLDKFCRQNFEQNERFWGRAFCRAFCAEYREISSTNDVHNIFFTFLFYAIFMHLLAVPFL